MLYLIKFMGTVVYQGTDRDLAKMIATAFAHAYNVRGWGRGTLAMGVDLGHTIKTSSSLLGHDAIAKVNDFFAHY